MTSNFHILNAPSETTRMRLAYEASRAAILAVPESELIFINVDVPSATATILGAVPKVKALAAQLAALPTFDATTLEKLEPYALALYETHGAYIDAIRPPAEITELVAAAIEARDVLRANALSLAKHGLFDKESIDGYRGHTAHKVVSTDLLVLTRGFRRRWADIEGKSPITGDALERAEMINEQLISAIGAREQAPGIASAAQLERQRAFTLAAKTYDEVRRGVQFLRYHQGDAEMIAPSIYAGRGGRARKEDEAPPEATPAIPAPSTPATATAPTAPRTISFANVSAPSEEVPPGFPGSSPFVRS